MGNQGRVPFGDAVRQLLAPVDSVKKLSELGAWGISLHDNDLVPFNAAARERDRIVREFKQAPADYGMIVPMATTNLFYHPIFKDGAFTSVDPAVRAFCAAKDDARHPPRCQTEHCWPATLRQLSRGRWHFYRPERGASPL